MGFYDAFKDAINLAQKADNIELYRQLLDLSAQALDMQEEIAKLRLENQQLKNSLDRENDIVYHKTKKINELYHEHPYITLASDEQCIRYCAICWGLEKKLIPLYNDLNCIVCRRRQKD